MERNNTNLFEAMRFRLSVERLPDVNFFGKSISLPSISISASRQPTPFTNISIPGDHIQYSELSLTFRVDEEFDNYISILRWMEEIGFPESFDQYATPVRALTGSVASSKISDGTVSLFSSMDNPKIEFTFEGLHPVSLSGINIDITQSDMLYAECEATFAYTKFTVSKPN